MWDVTSSRSLWQKMNPWVLMSHLLWHCVSLFSGRGNLFFCNVFLSLWFFIIATRSQLLLDESLLYTWVSCFKAFEKCLESFATSTYFFVVDCYLCHPGFLRHHARCDASYTFYLFFWLFPTIPILPVPVLSGSLTTYPPSGVFHAQRAIFVTVYAITTITFNPNWSSTCTLSTILL